MGYTHYFLKKELTHPQEKWDAFTKDVLNVAKNFNLCNLKSVDFIKEGGMLGNPNSPISIGDGSGEGNAPEFSKDCIWINGVGDESHETLHIERDSSKITGYQKDQWEKDKELFGFTKTNHKPYDIMVTATLLLYKHHFKELVIVSGDGGPDGFQEALELVNGTNKTSISMEDVYPTEQED